MPNPQQYYQRQVSPVPTAGNVSGSALGDMPSPSDVFRTGLISQRVYEELGRAGNMLTGFGMNALKENKQAEYHDQLSKAKLNYLQNDYDFKESLAQNADTSTWQPKLEERQQAFRTSGYKITNKDAANDFELWLKGQEIEQSHYVNTQKLGVDAENFRDNFNAGVKLRSVLAMQSPDDQTYQKYVVDMAGEYGLQLNKEQLQAITDKKKVDLTDIKAYEPISDWNNESLVGPPETRQKLFELWLLDTNTKRQKLVLEGRKNTVLDIATSHFVKNEDGRIDIATAQKFIQKTDLPAEDKLDVMKKVEDWDKQEQINNENAWVEWQGQRDAELDKLFSAHDYTGGLKVIDTAESGLKEEYASKQLAWKTQKRKLFEGALKGDVELNIPEYAKISRRIQTAQTDKEFEQIISDISEGTGKNWDGTKAGQLIDDVTTYRKPDSPLKSPRALLYSGKLYDLYKENNEALEPDLDKIREYDHKSEELDKWIVKNPDATSSQVAEFYRDLTQDTREKESSGIIQGLLNLSPAYHLLKLSPAGRVYAVTKTMREARNRTKKEPEEIDIFRTGKETKSPYSEYPDAFQEDGVWKVIKDGKKYRVQD